MARFDSSLSELLLLIDSPKENLQNPICDSNKLFSSESLDDTDVDDNYITKRKILTNTKTTTYIDLGRIKLPQI